MPLPHVWGENDLAGADDVVGEPAQPGDAPACTRSRVGTRRGSRVRAARGTRRARGSARRPRSGCRPAAAARRARRSRRGAAAPPSSTRCSAASCSATSVARSTSHGGRVSHGIRQPWLQSTISSSASPTASRIARTTARSSVERRRARSGPSAPGIPSRPRRWATVDHVGERAVNAGRRVGADAPTRARRCSDHTGRSWIWPARSHSATSSGQGRPAWNSMLASTARVAIEVERVLADEVALVVGEAVHRVAGADADVAGVVVDPHDRRREVGARAAGPTRRGTVGRAGAGGG